MTISTSYAPEVYAGNGSTTVFAVTFEFANNSSYLLVSLKNDASGVITPKTITTHYTVSGSNVTMLTAPASGETLLIELSPPFTQLSDYTENGALPAETLELDLDTLTLGVQAANDATSRSVKVDASVDLGTFSATLPDPIASGILGFNSTATGLDVLELGALGAISIPVSVANGGTGETTLTTDSVLTGNGTSAVQAEANVKVVSGVLTLSNGATGPGEMDFLEDSDNGTNKIKVIAPASIASDKTVTLQDVTGTVVVTGGADLTVPDGGTGLSSTTAYAVLCGGTTSTAALQSIASVGTSGHRLTSNGAGALPTFQVSPHKVVGFASATTNTSVTTTTVIPYDDTIPQNTEGVEFMSISYTPVSASNNLLISFSATTGSAGAVVADSSTFALFVDSTANALQAIGGANGPSGYVRQCNLQHVVNAGSTSSRTYKIRVGSGTAVSCKVLGSTSQDLYGTVGLGVMTVTEYEP